MISFRTFLAETALWDGVEVRRFEAARGPGWEFFKDGKRIGRVAMTEEEWRASIEATGVLPPAPPAPEPPAPEPPAPEPPAPEPPAPEPPPPVVVKEPPAWTVPTPRGNTVRGQSDLVVQSGTLYEDCTRLTIPNNAADFTIIGGIDMPRLVRGWKRFWIGGREDALMNAGPRADAAAPDLQQVKRYPYNENGLYPEDGVFAFIRLHDVTRAEVPEGAALPHADGVQLMAGKRITYGGCIFEDMGTAVQPWFLAPTSAAAGGGAIEDVVVEDSEFRRNVHWYDIFVARSLRSGARRCNFNGGAARFSREFAVERVWEENTNARLVLS